MSCHFQLTNGFGTKSQRLPIRVCQISKYLYSVNKVLHLYIFVGADFFINRASGKNDLQEEFVLRTEKCLHNIGVKHGVKNRNKSLFSSNAKSFLCWWLRLKLWGLTIIWTWRTKNTCALLPFGFTIGNFVHLVVFDVIMGQLAWLGVGEVCLNMCSPFPQ